MRTLAMTPRSLITRPMTVQAGGVGLSGTMIRMMFSLNRHVVFSFHPETLFFPDAETARFQFGNEQFFLLARKSSNDEEAYIKYVDDIIVKTDAAKRKKGRFRMKTRRTKRKRY